MRINSAAFLSELPLFSNGSNAHSTRSTFEVAILDIYCTFSTSALSLHFYCIELASSLRQDEVSCSRY
ncbi:MAG: hypothetical protein ABIQ95_08210, partial [Bdellovibrionia bacterium]